MTLPMYADELGQHYRRLQARFARRDSTHALLHNVRQGRMRDMFPSELNFNLTFDGVPIANFIDTTAADLRDVLAPLPSLACVSGKMKSDKDQQRAEIKNRIGYNYWDHSKLAKQMLTAADRYCTYGFIPFFVEPDVDNDMPFIHAEDPRHAYYELDRYGRPKIYYKRWMRTVDDLCAMYPEFETQIRGDVKNGVQKMQGENELELVRRVDKTSVSLFLPTRQGLVLSKYDHKLPNGRLPVWIAEIPHEGEHPRGMFDDVIWVQVSRAIMSTLALEAASMAIQAPIAVPDDMTEFPIGPHALLQSEKANEIHRVPLELPNSIFAETQNLDEELKRGARYPDARTGNVNASVITGKGVEALMGTFDSMVKGAQMIFKEALEEITSICFAYDVAWWPKESKVVCGVIASTSYEFYYTPETDIADRTRAIVTYGFAAGMNPSQSIITMLQLEGAGLISKATTQENLPFDMDHLQEQRKMDIEMSREALKTGVLSVLQNSGAMAAQGQDPMPFLKMASAAIANLQSGETVEEALVAAFQQMEQEQQQAAAEAQAQAQQAAQGQAAPGDAGPGGGGDTFGPGTSTAENTTPGAGADTGMPDTQQLIAGFRGTGNSPTMSATVRRNVPVQQ